MSATRNASLAWELKVQQAQEKLRKDFAHQITLAHQVTLDHQKISAEIQKRPTQ